MNEKEYKELQQRLILLMKQQVPDMEDAGCSVYVVRGLKIVVQDDLIRIFDSWSDYREIKAPIVLEAIITHITNE